MSKTVAQIYAANPSTTILDNDLIYMVQSPYTPGTDTAILGSDVKGTFLQRTNNLSDLTNIVAARTHLGLSALATATPPLALTLGGTGASLVASNGGIFYSTGTAAAILGGTATAGQILQSGASSAPSWSTATYPSAAGTSGNVLTSDGTNWISAASSSSGTVNPGTANQIAYYATTGSTISGLVSANTSVLTTDSSGVPGFTAYVSTDVANGGTSNIVARDANGSSSFKNVNNAIETHAAGSSYTLTVASARNQNISGVGATTLKLPDATTLPSGLVYYVNNNGSGAITVQYNDGTTLVTMQVQAYAQLILLSNATSNGTWDFHWLMPNTSNVSGAAYLSNGLNAGYRLTSATYPFSTTANQLLYSSATNTVGGLSSANNGTLVTSSSGVPSILAGPGTTGNFLQSNAAAAPSWSTSTITLGGNFTMSGAFTFTGTLTNTTAVTFPTSGTLATTSQLLTSPLTTKGDIWVWSTTNDRLPVATGDGKILQVSSAASTGLAYSTPTYPSASGTSGTILRSNGTNNIYSTSTFADTYTASNLLYSNGANTVTGLATANNGILVTNGSGVPSIGNTVGAGLTMPSITFNSTTGVVGTTTNNDAAAGSVGEYIESIILVASQVSLTSLTAANITSISLTAGDWDVWGEVWFNGASTTAPSSFAGAVTPTSGTFPTVPATGTAAVCNAFTEKTPAAAGVQNTVGIAPCRVSLSGTTTYYLIARSGFITSTMAAYGKICARRVR